MFLITNKGNMAQSHQVRKLNHVDRVDHQSNKQIFPRSRGNPEIIHATDKTRSNTSKIKYTDPTTCSIWDNNQRTPKNNYNIYVKVTRMKDTIYTDQIGKFLVNSRRRNKCLIIMCKLYINEILAEPIKLKQKINDNHISKITEYT